MLLKNEIIRLHNGKKQLMNGMKTCVFQNQYLNKMRSKF